MRLLLDTHIALWAVTDSPMLSPKARLTIEQADAGPVCVSVVSIWEIAIKHALRRGSGPAFPISGRTALSRFEAAGFTILSVTPAHATNVDPLPTLPKDPFDRLLIAQATSEAMYLVKHDALLGTYSEFVRLV